MSSKKLYIEWLRIIAILFVIYNHTWTWGCDLYRVTTEDSSRLLSILMFPLCKTAVPIFMMIAGANLLAKQESVKDLYRKRVLRYIIVIFLFGTLQFLRYVRGGHISFTITNWIKAIYSEPTIEPYWFLYLYLGFLLTLPFLRKMAVYMEKKDFKYLFILICVCRVFTVIGYFSGISLNGYVFFIAGNSAFFYPLIGYGLEKYCDETDRKRFIMIFLNSLTITLLCGGVYKLMNPDDIDSFTNIMQVLTPQLSIGIFGLLKSCCHKKNTKGSNVIMAVSGTAFGIYLIEEIIRRQVEKILIKTQLSTYINDFLVAGIFTLSVFLIGVCIIFLLKKLPILKEFL